jgi:magnesium transporter
VLWALVVGAVAYLWFGNIPLSIVIGIAMIVNLLIAAVSGALIPLALKAMRIDPALAGGVVLTTVTDVVGFMAFLGLATVFLL